MSMDVIVDSGAYSSWRKGPEIDLPKYIRYIKDNEQHVSQYISLDVIPGRFGQREFWLDAIEAAAALSYENHQVMRAALLHPLPIFHQDDNFRWLERYLKDGEGRVRE
jgi:hypothetical protein